MNDKKTKFNENRKSIFFLISAIVLHVLSMYFVVCLQNIAYFRCSFLTYMLLKFISRWFYLLVPVCFMKIEHIKLKEIGITGNKLFIQVITGLFIGSVAAVAIVGLTVLSGFQEQLGDPIYEEGWQYIFYFIYTIFAVGLFEEIFFRGYIYKKLSDIIEEKWLIIIISSFIFGACHFVGNGSFLQDIPQVILSTVMGIFYCVLREKIKNCTLISLIFMHGIYDFCIAFLIFIL